MSYGVWVAGALSLKLVVKVPSDLVASDLNVLRLLDVVIVSAFWVPVSDLISNLTPLPVSIISAPMPPSSFKAFLRPSTVLLVELIVTVFESVVELSPSSQALAVMVRVPVALEAIKGVLAVAPLLKAVLRSKL